MSAFQNQLDFVDTMESDNTNIYQQLVIEKLIYTLKSKYRCTVFLMGEKNFTELAYQYAKNYPSRFPSLQTYGEYFPIFINTYCHLPYKSHFSHIASIESNSTYQSNN